MNVYERLWSKCRCERFSRSHQELQECPESFPDPARARHARHCDCPPRLSTDGLPFIRSWGRERQKSEVWLDRFKKVVFHNSVNGGGFSLQLGKEIRKKPASPRTDGPGTFINLLMTHSSSRYQIHPFSSILRGWRERRHGSQHRLGGSDA